MNRATRPLQATAECSGRRTARRVDVIVIGAGHNGLAISRHLNRLDIDHLVLERGDVANSWRRERWDSLRLLTPNWLCRLPDQPYSGNDPNGYMAVAELADHLTGYAERISAPIVTQCAVRSLQPTDDGYLVVTSHGNWRCRAAVIASGACNIPVIPTCSSEAPARVTQLTPHEYRHPGQVEPGGVLVVGASSTGIQLADEIQRAGHPVTLCVGEHVRMPRCYRGHDILWWMEQLGLLDEGYRDIDDITRARNVPSSQLVGRRNQRTLDLNALVDTGVELVGRLVGLNQGKAHFSGSLPNVCQLADLKMRRLLTGIDHWIDAHPADAYATAEQAQPEPTRLSSTPRLRLDFANQEVRTIIWACGYRPDYSWLKAPVLDQRGRMRHNGGVTESPGLCVLGLPFLRRRKSSLICGADDDACAIGQHLSGYLRRITIPSTAKCSGGL